MSPNQAQHLFAFESAFQAREKEILVLRIRECMERKNASITYYSNTQDDTELQGNPFRICVANLSFVWDLDLLFNNCSYTPKETELRIVMWNKVSYEYLLLTTPPVQQYLQFWKYVDCTRNLN